MTTPLSEHSVVLFLVCGIALVLLALVLRRRAGFGSGRQLAADNLTLASKQLGLIGRPDRIVLEGGFYIPEEKKSANRVYPGHVLQLGAYFLLVEAHYRKRPPYGYIVLGNGQRHKVDNTSALRRKVKAAAGDMRKALREKPRSLPRGHKNAARCRSCAMAAYCQQKLA